MVGACLELLEGEIQAGHGYAGHTPELLLHAQDCSPVDIQQLCTAKTRNVEWIQEECSRIIELALPSM